MSIDNLLRDAGAQFDWQYIILYAILLAPAVVPGVLFIYFIYQGTSTVPQCTFSVRSSCVVINSSGDEAE